MFKGDISVSFRDVHPPNSSGVYMPIIRIPYERWDDHPQYREFLKKSRSQIALGRTHLLRDSKYIGQPLFCFCWNCVSKYVYISVYPKSTMYKKHVKNILECVHMYVCMLYAICWAIGEQIFAPTHTSREPSFSLEHTFFFSTSVHLSWMVANWRNPCKFKSHRFPSLPQLLEWWQTLSKNWWFTITWIYFSKPYCGPHAESLKALRCDHRWKNPYHPWDWYILPTCKPL